MFLEFSKHKKEKQIFHYPAPMTQSLYLSTRRKWRNQDVYQKDTIRLGVETPNRATIQYLH